MRILCFGQNAIIHEKSVKTPKYFPERLLNSCPSSPHLLLQIKAAGVQSNDMDVEATRTG